MSDADPKPTDTAGAPASSGDWQARAADLVESTVNSVHDKVVRPLLLLARALVFGIVVGAMALSLSVLVSVALVRLLDVYAFPGRVWASEALVGALLSAVGLVAWSFRRARHSAERG